MLSFSLYDLLALLIVTCGITLQGLVGIGFGLVAAPLLYLINPAYVPAPILISGFLLSVLLVLGERNSVDWRRVLTASLFRLPGAYLGTLLLLTLPQQSLSILFGLTLLFAIAVSWRAFSIQITPFNLATGGFFSGLIGTATSVGGPPIALVYQQLDRLTVRNELAAFFLIGTPVSILMLFSQDAVSDESLALTVKILPAVIAGWGLSRILNGRLKAGSAKPALLGISLLSALVVLIDGLSSSLG
ncbi:sulfite exporter TauE/SafE family protein [Marinobacterium jannaschii]|uniref:sulfite exporter TauE/SafE family protein n=1 Tax=Marinobacterium jannaschii TaxID=64970 RepID=UPI000A871803|nr:sulfite exporter TauE/SafE family protein [Marinobacterium jannaschii]